MFKNIPLVAAMALSITFASLYAHEKMSDESNFTGSAESYEEKEALKNMISLLRQKVDLQERREMILIDALQSQRSERIQETLDKLKDLNLEQHKEEYEDGILEEIPAYYENEEAIELVNSIGGMLENPQLAEDDVLEFMRSRLSQVIQEDSKAFDYVVDSLKETAGSEQGEILMSVLSLVKDSRVEEVAMGLADFSSSKEHRLAGLSLLDRLGSTTVASRSLILETLIAEGDTDIVRSAMYALKPSVTNNATRKDVTGALSAHVDSPDTELRRRSSIALAQWANTSEEIAPVVTKMSDVSVDVRAGAAYALGATNARSSSAKEALVAAVSDKKEDWAVRETAWYSLRSYDLTDEEVRIYDDFQSEIESAIEGRQASIRDRHAGHHDG